MKAVGFTLSQPISAPSSLVDIEQDRPKIRSRDLIIAVSAVSVNPVDAKKREYAAKEELPEPSVLGYDAVGRVVEVGSDVSMFQVGDRVYYSGDVTRQGTNAEFHAVDERIVAKAPETLSDVEAAVFPLVALTTWEAFFDRLKIDPNAENKSLLIIGGAGGVGSMATQIARQTTKLKVISTASRPETEAYVKEMGAHHVANHRDLIKSVRALGIDTVDYIFNVADTTGHWDAMVDLIAPQGGICCIVAAEGAVELSQLQSKSASFCWELMFTRAMHQTPDMVRQHEILTEVARLVDAGKLKTTLTKQLHGLSAETMKEAHRIIEEGKMLGKLGIKY